MKLEDQVVSLELAKEMKEMGFEQDSLWYWCKTVKAEKIKINCCIVNGVNIAKTTYIEADYEWDLVKGNYSFEESCSAYTCAELGDVLKFQTVYIKYDTMQKFWRIEKGCFCDGADTEADARAKMLIHLKQNNLN